MWGSTIYSKLLLWAGKSGHLSSPVSIPDYLEKKLITSLNFQNCASDYFCKFSHTNLISFKFHETRSSSGVLMVDNEVNKT